MISDRKIATERGGQKNFDMRSCVGTEISVFLHGFVALFIGDIKMKNPFAYAVLILAGLGFSIGVGATTITYVGSLTDFGSGWRTSTSSKGIFNIEGDNILGNDGYDVVGGSVSVLTPSYVTSISTNNDSVYGGNSSYASIDNPSTTPGAHPSLITTGTLNPFPGTNQPQNTFSFTLKSAVPGVIQIALLEDNLDIAGYNSSAVQLVGSAGTSGVSVSGTPLVSLTGTDYNDRIPDWVVFDISNAVAGQTFTVVNYGGPNGCACVGAIAFDSAINLPEPASLGILGVGVVGMVFAVRRQSRA